MNCILLYRKESSSNYVEIRSDLQLLEKLNPTDGKQQQQQVGSTQAVNEAGEIPWTHSESMPQPRPSLRAYWLPIKMINREPISSLAPTL